MKIVSFNLRFVWEGEDGKNSFIHRKEFVVSKIREEKPDVIAFQEMVEPIYEYLKKALPEYTFVGHGRTTEYAGEGVWTAFFNEKTDIFSVDTFWLTDKPYEPGSRLEGQSQCPRTCVKSVVKIENTFLQIYNLHLDHPTAPEFEEIRKKEMEIVFEKIGKTDSRFTPVILGDLNTQPDAPTAAYIRSMGFEDVCADSGITFHNFKGDSFECAMKIDYIFCKKQLAELCIKSEKWKDFNGNVYLSDHYPVCAVFKM